MRRMDDAMTGTPLDKKTSEVPALREKPKNISSLEDIVTTLEMQAPGLNSPVNVAQVADNLSMANLTKEESISLAFYVFGRTVADKIRDFLGQDKFKKLGLKVKFVDLPVRFKKINYNTMKNIYGISVTKGEILGGDQEGQEDQD